MHNAERLTARCDLDSTRLHGQIDLCQQFAAREIPNAYSTIIISYCDSRPGVICCDESRHPGNGEVCNDNTLLQRP